MNENTEKYRAADLEGLAREILVAAGLEREKAVVAMTDVLDRLIEALSPDVSHDKRAAVEEFYWLLEEYKISVFAQEVKTAVRVSRKMLLEKSKEIQRMI